MTVTERAVHHVLVVDDSAFMRKLIGEMILAEPDFHIVGFARNGLDALAQIETARPDVVTLDLEMPQLGGMQVLERLAARAREDHTTPMQRVVVLSAGGLAHGDLTMRALELGAIDFVKKPSGPISLDLPVIRERLIGALRTAVAADMRTVRELMPESSRADTVTSASGLGARETSGQARHATHVVTIASSTGGPRALAEVIPRLPGDLKAAVLIAQHMPKEFTASLASRLDHASVLAVAEAVDGERVVDGRVYVAPGGMNMRLALRAGAVCIALDAAVPGEGMCPSADALFASAGAMFGRDVTAVVLTGMGRDGSVGARHLRGQGASIIVQDRETSVIYGMPQAALHEAGADHVVPLGQVAQIIAQCVAERVS